MSRAIGASAWLICTAPVMTRRGGGTCTVRKTRPSGVSAMPLLPVRSRSLSTSFSGSRSTSAALTSRSSPLATSVTTITARRAARSAFSVLRTSSFTTVPRLLASLHFLHEYADGSAAREADFPRRLVGDAELQHFWLAALDHVDGLGDDRALDAATRHRAEKVAFLIDDQVRTDRAWRRAPGLDHGGERHPASLFSPVLRRFENVVVTCQHGNPPKSTSNMGAPVGRGNNQVARSRHPLEPRLGIGAAAGSSRQRRDKLGHGVEIVNGAELVHVRQHGADALRLGLEAVEAQERVEPDQAAARTMQPVDLEGERVVAVALQPVGDEQHDGALAEDAPAPIFVEGMQRAGDTGAARPVGDGARARR